MLFCFLISFAVIGVIPLASSAAGVKWLEGNIATLQALDKITARISTLEAPVGKESFFGTLEIKVHRCAFHPPEEPPESVAFISVRDVGYENKKPRKIFSGWMFASSPAVSALEHPVYDIIVLSCFQDRDDTPKNLPRN